MKKCLYFLLPLAVFFYTMSTSAYIAEIPCVMYHSVNKNPKNEFSITPALFEEDMKYLKCHGYQSVTLQEIYDSVYNGGKLPQKPVLITFDDGYRDVLYEALPILEKYEYTAVMAVTGASVGKTLSDFPHMNADELKMMDRSRIFELISHSYDLHKNDERVGASKLENETVGEYRKILTSDLAKSFSQLRSITGKSSTAFAYPYGAASDESVKILESAGVKTALLCEEAPESAADSSIIFIKRLCRNGTHTVERFFDYFNKVYKQQADTKSLL